MSSTTNPYKRNYKRRPRRKVATRNDRKIAKIAKQVIVQHEMKEVELKFHDVRQVFANITASGALYQLTSPIGKGTETYERIGNKIVVKSLLLRLLAQNASDESPLRFIIFRWFDNGAPTAGTVLEDITSIPSLSPLNTDNTNKMVVLYDQVIALNSVNNMTFTDKIFIKKNMNVEWTDASVMDSGHIFILAISDTVVNPPTLKWSARVRFTDQ